MTEYRDIHGRLRNATASDGACAGCGMACFKAEYHPWVACAAFKATGKADSVRANLNGVFEFGHTIGMKVGARAAKKRRSRKALRRGQ